MDMKKPFVVEILEQAEEFMLSRPKKMRAKIYWTIELLENHGYALYEPFSKTLASAEKLKELRVQFASDICRLFYFHHGEKLYVVTSGYVKKSQKTSPREIDKALRIMKDYIKEHGHG